MLRDGLPRIGLADPILPGGWGGSRHSTGLELLDERVGGLSAGELWVVTGGPGQGCSSLVSQFASRLAAHHAIPTWLVSSRDDSHVVAGRLLSQAAKVPLRHIADDRVTPEERRRLSRARDGLLAAPLSVFAGPGAADYWMSEQLGATPKEAGAVLFDDPGWGPPDLPILRGLAGSGWIVVVTLPRPSVLNGPTVRADLLDEIGEVDIVIEVRINNLAAAEAPAELIDRGYAAISVLRNRRGVTGTVFPQFHGHHARFVDPAPPGRINWNPA
jgi:replicative DNA helicase